MFIGSLVFLLLVCANAQAGPLFVDATGQAGLDRTTVSGGPNKYFILDSTGSGAAFFDYDRDGWMDLYLGASEYPGNRGLLFHQSSPLVFNAVSIEDAFEHNRSDGAVAADFDRDGDLDLLVGHSHMRCEPTMPNDCYPTRQIRLFENVIGQDASWLQLEKLPLKRKSPSFKRRTI